uniref:Uncharacterized protein n=1 Tax=Arundo donax TaxID=35708 RepID=A0A0A9AR14_ARUDO
MCLIPKTRISPKHQPLVTFHWKSLTRGQ